MKRYLLRLTLSLTLGMSAYLHPFAGIFVPLSEGNLTKLKSLIAKDRDCVNNSRCFFSVPSFTNERLYHNITPLHFTALFPNLIKAAKVLLKCGAGIHARDEANDTPLSYAIEKNNLEFVKLIIDQDPSCLNEECSFDKFTPLHIAVGYDNKEAAQILIAKGAAINALTTGNNTPLHLAAEGKNSEIIQLLVEHGANIDARNIDNKTPLDIAETWGKPEIAQFLREIKK